ncbi:MAG TPA: hypothetical protein DCE56_07220 [Cyanobacteria bacterium UBA8553]|nr:hypothetical protein [Cyanobacteria bacterium UBA8553]
MPNYRSSSKAVVNLVKSILLSAILLVGIWVVLFTGGYVTLGGVPAPIIMKFLSDETAREAYFQGDRTKLHNRLDDMGIEDDIKAYYRPQIPDEAQLDQYIHQIFYERTGYVGEGYRVNSQGVLVLKS